jgi:sulfopropanediol 3-dehydrogenase
VIRTLKSGRSQAVKAATSKEVRTTVEEILGDVAERGDEAVRHYSTTFDG